MSNSENPRKNRRSFLRAGALVLGAGALIQPNGGAIRPAHADDESPKESGRSKAVKPMVKTDTVGEHKLTGTSKPAVTGVQKTHK